MQDCIGVHSNSVNTGTTSAKVQDCIGVTYTATQSILGLFKLEVNYSSNCFSKSARLHRSHLYSNSVNTGTTSAKVQDCIGVTYTATQSTLELFKLEVDYSSTSFCKSERLHRSCLYSNSTLELFKLEVDYISTSFPQNS